MMIFANHLWCYALQYANYFTATALFILAVPLRVVSFTAYRRLPIGSRQRVVHYVTREQEHDRSDL